MTFKGHSRSLEMSEFDRVHDFLLLFHSNYDLSCIVSLIITYGQILVEIKQFIYPNCIHCPTGGDRVGIS